MLKSLLGLKNCSMTITTLDNGQINLAVFSEGKAPLTMNFTANDAALAEGEIAQYCGNQAPVTNVSVGTPITTETASAPAPAKAPKAAKATPAAQENATPAPEAAPEAAPQPKAQSLVDEDDILDAFTL